MAEPIYLGTDIKVRVLMEAPGFSMANDDWEVIFKCGGKVVATRAKADCIQDSTGNWYALLRGSEMKNGELSVVFHAKVPDYDWDDSIRNEYDKKTVGSVVKL